MTDLRESLRELIAHLENNDEIPIVARRSTVIVHPGWINDYEAATGLVFDFDDQESNMDFLRWLDGNRLTP